VGACTFVEELPSGPMVPGYTAFAEKDNAWGRDTAIYLPLSHSFRKDVVDVVLWFHGFYVSDVRDLIHPVDSGKDMKLRESVRAEKKDVIFVAPYLGLSEKMSLGPLGEGNGCEDYLDKVLDGIRRFRKSAGKNAADSLDLGHLIIAGHSAGGAMMKAAAAHLGGYKSFLKEVWGFDCFYDGDYETWSRANPGPEKVFYIGNGSGGGGSYAFDLMKAVYGTPRSPIKESERIPRLKVAPAVDKIYTGNDTIAFQAVVEDPDDWNPAGRNVYTDVRTATDRYLGDADHTRYWSNLRPRLSDHFQVVRDLVGPRIRQSRWLKAAS
jgi:hypothetical protein